MNRLATPPENNPFTVTTEDAELLFTDFNDDIPSRTAKVSIEITDYHDFNGKKIVVLEVPTVIQELYPDYQDQIEDELRVEYAFTEIEFLS